MKKIPSQMRMSFMKSAPKTSGGSQQRSNPKTKRPFSSKAPLHLVLRAQTGMPSLYRRERAIRDFAYTLAKAWGLKIYALANVGNHIHLAIQAPDRDSLSAFLRGLSGTIARMALGAAKGNARLAAGKAFWLGRPYTRIVSWGQDFRAVKEYVAINVLEGQARVCKQKARELMARIRALQVELREGKLASLQFYGVDEPAYCSS